MNDKNKIVYPGTFDPMTLGHEDLVRRAADLFDHVVVAVAESGGKSPMLSMTERVEMAQEALSSLANVEVQSFTGLLVNFLRETDAKNVLRGLRAISDFEYEFQMACMNRKLYPEIETVFLTPEESYMFISGTMVREIAKMGGDIKSFVSPTVLKRVSLVIERK